MLGTCQVIILNRGMSLSISTRAVLISKTFGLATFFDPHLRLETEGNSVPEAV